MENNILDAPESAGNYREYASFGSRFGAALLDGLLLMVAQFIIFSIFGVSSAFSGAMDPETVQEGIGGSVIFAYLLSTAVGIAYYAYYESSAKQATLGKQAFGLVVTNMNGERITALNAVGRYFAKIVSAMILLIGYLMQPFTQRKQALHDMLAGTLVYKN